MDAVHTNGVAPTWAGILMAAKEWGCPPWEIAGGDKLTWYFRFQELTKELAKKERMESGE